MTLEDDYEAIRELIARFGQTLDFCDADGFVACFAPDGILDVSAGPDDLAGVYRGSEGLKDFIAGSYEYNAGHVRHIPAQSLIEIANNTAKATSYVVITRDYGPPEEIPGDLTYAELTTTGMYFDEFRKTGGQWLFTKRVFRHDGLPDVMARVGRPVAVGPAA
jgi:hypothetical protein